MDSLALDNLSNFSWDKEGFKDEISFESVNLVPKKQVSALKHAKFYSNSRVFNIFLHVALNSSSKGFHQVSVKLPLDITIQEALYEIFAAFDVLLKKQNAPFTIVEDTTIWQMRVAKKTGYPKDYIPAIDQNNQMKSIDCFLNLVLFPIKQSECIQMISSSTICSTTTKPCSNASDSPQSAAESNYCGSVISDNNNFTAKINGKASLAKQTGKPLAKKTQLSSFEKDYNNSTSCSDNKKSFKNGLSSNYSSRAFLGKEEEDDIDTLSSSRAQRISKTNKEEIAQMQKNKKKSFFSFLCC